MSAKPSIKKKKNKTNKYKIHQTLEKITGKIKKHKLISFFLFISSILGTLISIFKLWSDIFNLLSSILEFLSDPNNLLVCSVIGCVSVGIIWAIIFFIRKKVEFLGKIRPYLAALMLIFGAIFIITVFQEKGIDIKTRLKIAFFFPEETPELEIASYAAELALKDTVMDKSEVILEIDEYPYKGFLKEIDIKNLSSGYIGAISVLPDPKSLLHELDKREILSNIVFVSASPSNPSLHRDYSTFGSCAVPFPEQFQKFSKFLATNEIKRLLVLHSEKSNYFKEIISDFQKIANEQKMILSSVSLLDSPAPEVLDETIKFSLEFKSIFLLMMQDEALIFIDKLKLSAYKGIIYSPTWLINDTFCKSAAKLDARFYFVAAGYLNNPQVSDLGYRLQRRPFPILTNSYLAAKLINNALIKQRKLDSSSLADLVFQEHSVGLEILGIEKIRFTTNREPVLDSNLYKIHGGNFAKTKY